LLVVLFLCACKKGNGAGELYGPVTYVAVGASDTVGVGAENPDKEAWVAQLFARLPEGSKFVRLGVSGSTADQAIAEQLPQAVEANGDLATVWLAVNDFNSFIPISDYEADLTEILKRIADSGARVFVGNVPDLSNVPVYNLVPRGVLSSRIEEWNKSIEKVAESNDAVLVDLVPSSKKLAAEGGSLIASDGFHPSAEGYRVIADAFWEEISSDELIGSRVAR
jgi:acyl-CoA thioesterase-1